MLSKKQLFVLSLPDLSLNKSLKSKFVSLLVSEEFVCHQRGYRMFEDIYTCMEIYNRKGERILKTKKITMVHPDHPGFDIHINGHVISICMSGYNYFGNAKLIASDHCPDEFFMISNAIYKGEKNESLKLLPDGHEPADFKEPIFVNSRVLNWFLRDINYRLSKSVDTYFLFQ